MTISHTEAFQQITTGALAYKTYTFPLNPGVGAMFPWLSQIADRFESYRFHKLEFDFITRAPTTSTGSVILSVDFDALDPAPVDQLTALSHENACADAPWKSSRLPVRVSPSVLNQIRYIRVGLQPPGSDIKTYDLGNLFVSLDSCTTNITLGLLSVR